MKVITDMEQGSREWHDMRRCKITGSKLENVMGTSLARVQQIAELIAEEGTEASKIMRPTEEMERGTYEEAFALKKFEEMTGKTVTKVAATIHDELPWLLCSPDGLIADANGDYTEAVEVKSPDSKTAIFYKLTNMIPLETLGLGTWPASTKANPTPAFKPSAKAPFYNIPADYKWQVVNYFLVNEKLERLHFVVYDARFIEEKMKLTIDTVTREQMAEAILEARAELGRFRSDWLAWKEIVLPTEF